jgi:small conductance mechanosensitive channel
LDQSIPNIWRENVVPLLFSLGLAILIFLVFWIAARILRRLVQKFAISRGLMPDLTSILLQITEVGLLLFGAISALGTIGVDVWALIAGLGLVGFAIGFALKDLVSNFISGLLILIYNPFVRGDRVTVSGQGGMVIEINLRYTVLKDDEKKILIPNSSMFSNIVTVERKTVGN